nr:hypothetical protein CFP56_26598 [Quercus suber]
MRDKKARKETFKEGKVQPSKDQEPLKGSKVSEGQQIRSSAEGSSFEVAPNCHPKLTKAEWEKNSVDAALAKVEEQNLNLRKTKEQLAITCEKIEVQQKKLDFEVLSHQGLPRVLSPSLEGGLKCCWGEFYLQVEEPKRVFYPLNTREVAPATTRETSVATSILQPARKPTNNATQPIDKSSALASQTTDKPAAPVSQTAKGGEKRKGDANPKVTS